MVLVGGDAGIGKTRLVLEFARRVLDDAVVVPISGDDTFRPVLPAIAAALGGARRGSCRTRRSASA